MPIISGTRLTYENEIYKSLLLNDVRTELGIGASEYNMYFNLQEKRIKPYIKKPSKAIV